MHWFARSFFHFGEHRISAEDKVSHQFSDSCEAPRKNSPKETERAINFTLIKHLIFLFICCENFSDFEEREKRKICLSILREKSFILNVSELYGILLCYETIELKKLFIVETSECARENLDLVWCNKIYMDGINEESTVLKTGIYGENYPWKPHRLIHSHYWQLLRFVAKTCFKISQALNRSSFITSINTFFFCGIAFCDQPALWRNKTQRHRFCSPLGPHLKGIH